MPDDQQRARNEEQVGPKRAIWPVTEQVRQRRSRERHAQQDHLAVAPCREQRDESSQVREARDRLQGRVHAMQGARQHQQRPGLLRVPCKPADDAGIDGKDPVLDSPQQAELRHLQQVRQVQMEEEQRRQCACHQERERWRRQARQPGQATARKHGHQRRIQKDDGIAEGRYR